MTALRDQHASGPYFLYGDGWCGGCGLPKLVQSRRWAWPGIFVRLCEACWDDVEGYCLSFEDTVTADRFAAWQVMVRS